MSNYNLDDGITEYFEFKIFGHSYKFRYPSTEEMVELSELSKSTEFDAIKNNILFDFITSDDGSNFQEDVKKMNLQHWKAFNDMIMRELGNESQSAKNPTNFGTN